MVLAWCADDQNTMGASGMNITKIIGTAIVAVGFSFSAAQAVPITAVWNGTVNYSSGSQDVFGQSVQMTFSYDSDAVSAANVYDYPGYYTGFNTSNNPNFFSSVSVALSGGASYSMPTPVQYSEMLLGDSTDYYKDLYYNYASDNAGNTLYAYFYNTAVGGVTSADPANIFSHVVNPYDPSEYGVMYFSFYSGGDYYSGYAQSYYSQDGNISVALNGTGVPAPGALALLGLGLLGFAGMRRKFKTV